MYGCWAGVGNPSVSSAASGSSSSHLYPQFGALYFSVFSLVTKRVLDFPGGQDLIHGNRTGGTQTDYCSVVNRVLEISVLSSLSVQVSPHSEFFEQHESSLQPPHFLSLDRQPVQPGLRQSQLEATAGVGSHPQSPEIGWS